jgi:hypothetical protein
VSGVWVALGVAVLATQCWRVLAALLGPRVAGSPRLAAATDGMACAVVAGVVATMVLGPGTGALGGVSVEVRVVALALAVAAYFACRRSVAAGVAVGFAALTAGAAASG